MSNKTYQLILSTIIGIAAAFFFWYPISDGDIFWHLAAGREIVHTHAIPHTDPFSFTSHNLQWIDLHWLFQVLMYGIQALLGLKGILIANSFFLGLAAGLLFFITAPVKAAPFSALLWMAALFEVRYLAPHRPIMASLLLIAVFICCLEQYGRKNKLRYLALLLPLQIVWTNMQPLFVLGPCIISAWLAGEFVHAFLIKGPERMAAKQRLPPLVVMLVLLCLVSLVNPYGAQAFSLAFMLFGRLDPSPGNLFSVAISENRPLLALFGTPDAHYAWAAVAITAFACIVIAMKPKKVRFPYLFAAAGMLFLAFRAQRNIILYFFAVLPLINMLIAAMYESLTKQFPALFRSIALSGMTAVALLAGFAVSSHALMLVQTRGSGPVAPFSFPDGSVAYLDAHPITGNCFNADRFGGYLLWKKYPPKKVFIDTRYAIRPNSFLAEYCAILDDPMLFKAVVEKYDISIAMLPAAFVTRYIKLTASLMNDPDWRLVYADGTEVLFIKAGKARTDGLDLGSAVIVDSLARNLTERWKSSYSLRCEAATHLAEFLSAMGKKESADRAYRCIGR